MLEVLENGPLHDVQRDPQGPVHVWILTLTGGKLTWVVGRRLEERVSDLRDGYCGVCGWRSGGEVRYTILCTKKCDEIGSGDTLCDNFRTVVCALRLLFNIVL